MRSLLEEVGLYQKQKLTDRDGDLLKCNAAKSRVLTSKQGKLRRLREGILVLGLRNSARVFVKNTEPSGTTALLTATRPLEAGTGQSLLPSQLQTAPI